MIVLLKRKIICHIRYNKKFYSLFSAIFILGTIIGGIVSSSVASDEMLTEMSIFFSVYSLFGTDNLVLFANVVLRNMRFLFLLFLCGFFPVTVPIIFIFIAFFGFEIGFSTMFFVGGFGGGGIVLTMLLVWLPRLMILPIIFHFAQVTIRRVRNKRHSISQDNSAASSLIYITHVKDFMFSASLLVICGMVEAFIFPVILRVVTGFFI